MGEEPLKNEELMLLKKYSIGSSLLNTCPIWLQRWAALTIYFIDLEKQLLPIMLYKAEKRERDLNKKSLIKKNKKRKIDIKSNEKNKEKNKKVKKLNGKNSENNSSTKKKKIFFN